MKKIINVCYFNNVVKSFVFQSKNTLMCLNLKSAYKVLEFTLK